MSDATYVKQLEDENEKLRKQLADTQELLDTANAKIKISNIEVGGKYVPHEKEIVGGFQIYDVSDTPYIDSLLFTCLKTTKSFFGKEKKEWFIFRASMRPKANKGFDASYYLYPEGTDMDLYGFSGKKAIASQLFEVARQNNFFVLYSDQSSPHGFKYLPYFTKDGKKKSLKRGIIQYEPV